MELFPTTLVDCSLPQAQYDNRARWEYACTTNAQLRWPMTISHLLIMVSVFMVTFIVYSVYARLVDRRLANKLKGTTASTSRLLLPVGRDVVSRSVQQHIFDGFAAAVQDFSPAAALSANMPPGQHGGAGGGMSINGHGHHAHHRGGHGGGGGGGEVDAILASLVRDARVM